MTASPLFTSLPLESGLWAWTLTTRFGSILREAEARYGPREMDWTPIGVEFALVNVPHIWFPGNGKNVCIRLTMGGLNDFDCALWELAHETVHVLAPVPSGKANNLEEGLATHFALISPHYTSNARRAFYNFRVREATCKYAQPLADCEALLQCDPDIIKKLRSIQPYISRITSDQILSLAPQFSTEIAERLAAPFDMTNSGLPGS